MSLLDLCLASYRERSMRSLPLVCHVSKSCIYMSLLTEAFQGGSAIRDLCDALVLQSHDRVNAVQSWWVGRRYSQMDL
jgi:hypothetical protein